MRLRLEGIYFSGGGMGILRLQLIKYNQENKGLIQPTYGSGKAHC